LLFGLLRNLGLPSAMHLKFRRRTAILLMKMRPFRDNANIIHHKGIFVNSFFEKSVKIIIASEIKFRISHL